VKPRIEEAEEKVKEAAGAVKDKIFEIQSKEDVQEKLAEANTFLHTTATNFG